MGERSARLRFPTDSPVRDSALRYIEQCVAEQQHRPSLGAVRAAPHVLGLEYRRPGNLMISLRKLNAQPWRFKPGAIAYVRGWPAEKTALVTDRAAVAAAFPHYLVVDLNGKEWCIAQVELSKHPIVDQ